MKRISSAVGLTLALTAFDVQALGLDITYSNTASGVLFEYSGSFDLGNFTPIIILSPPDSEVLPSLGGFSAIGPAGLGSVFLSDDALGAFGGAGSAPLIASGGTVSIIRRQLIFSPGYQSLDPINGSALAPGVTVADLGLFPATFDLEGNTVSFIAAVPVPASLVLMLTGLSGLAFISRRRAA